VSNTGAIRIVVNGEEHTVPEGQTVLDLLRALNVNPERVAVEMDRRIVKSADWATTGLHQGAQVEIVTFVGGG
jgi:thiamine biosynthesis protein ThiS